MRILALNLEKEYRGNSPQSDTVSLFCQLNTLWQVFDRFATLAV